MPSKQTRASSNILPKAKKKTAKPSSKKNKTEGMTYPKTSAEGHAGEYLFAYWISRYFRWPCRLLDIDMGLDAQVEIYTNGLSTGLFIGVQVKTTSRKMESNLSIQIPYKNIKYWGDCEHPVVIVLICLNEDNDMEEPDIYWKHLDVASISLLKRRSIKNKNGCASVRFNNDDYLAQIADKPKWVNLWLTDDDKKIIELAKETNLKILKMGLAFDNENESYLYNTDYFIQDLNIMLNKFDRIKFFSQARKRLLDLVPSVKECSESYHKYAQKFLKHFEIIVHSSIGSYDVRENFNDCDDINYTLQKKLKEMIPSYK